MRVYIVLLLLATILATTYATSSTWGDRNGKEFAIKYAHIKKESKWLKKISEDFIFDQKSEAFPKIITQIVAMDNSKNNHGGTATLVTGGPNTDHATIHIKSQRGHGYDFDIWIYGQQKFP